MMNTKQTTKPSIRAQFRRGVIQAGIGVVINAAAAIWGPDDKVWGTIALAVMMLGAMGLWAGIANMNQSIGRKDEAKRRPEIFRLGFDLGKTEAGLPNNEYIDRVVVGGEVLYECKKPEAKQRGKS